MTHRSSRVFPVTLNGRGRPRLWRLAVALLLSLGLALTTSACGTGTNVQTLNPYTPSNGVNFDAGDVRIRGLLVLSRSKGEGFLVGHIVSAGTDSLQGITGTAMKADGSEGAPLNVALGSPIRLTNGSDIELLTRPIITIRSADLEEGLTVKMVLNFERAGEVSSTVPVLDADAAEYVTASPSPAAAATPSG